MRAWDLACWSTILAATLCSCGGRSDGADGVREMYDAGLPLADEADAASGSGGVEPNAEGSDGGLAQPGSGNAGADEPTSVQQPGSTQDGSDAEDPSAATDDEPPTTDDVADDSVSDSTSDDEDMTDDDATGDDEMDQADDGVDDASPMEVAGDLDCGVAPNTQLRRLTNRQYDNTIEDLLGLSALDGADGGPPSDLLPTSDPSVVTASDWEAYRSVAQLIAEQVVADESLVANFLQCPLMDGETCLREAIPVFGRRAFRRPLSDDEITNFERLITAGIGSTATEVAQALLTAFLVSPSFIQIVELSDVMDGAGNYALSSHELAVRLSYLLWNTMPDAQLATLADAASLGTSDQVFAEAGRMTQSPKLAEGITVFHRAYMQMGTGSRWEWRDKDEVRFPLYSEAMLPSLQAEIERYFAEVITSGGTFADLFLSDIGFVDARTARVYGIDPGQFGDSLERVVLADRPGFLTRAGFLNALSDFDKTAPILRGAFITRRVLGIDVPDEPPFPVDPPTPDLDGAETNRERVAASTAFPECAGCHEPLLNQPGYVLEAYDAIGAFQTVEIDTGAPIDTEAEVFIDGTQVPVAGPVELMAALAESSDARRRYARDWINYATGRGTDSAADDCAVEELADKLNASDYTIVDMLGDLTLTPQFRSRTTGSAQ